MVCRRRSSRTQRRSIAGAAAWFVLSMAAAAAAQTVSDASLDATTYVTGLSSPTTMAFVSSNDVLVLQKDDGKVIHVASRTPRPTPALDVAVNNESERGLLGIAVNTEDPPAVFLYYTAVDDPDGNGGPDTGTPLGNRVYRYTWNAATGRLENGQLVLDLPVLSGPNHNGGVLLLGPTPTPGMATGGHVGDGSFLHVIIGDLNRNGQLQNAAGGAPPDDTGVILRVQQDGTPAAANPFVPYCSVTTAQTCPSGTGCPAGETCVDAVARYFAYGVRNSFGLTLDPLTGNLWDTENGPQFNDEVNLVLPGFNSGWTQLMGLDGRDPQGVADLFAMPGNASAYSDPEFSWLDTVAPTAILFPVGSTLGSAYDNVALVGDNNFGQIYRLPLTAPRTGFDLSAFTGLSDLVADSVTERNRVRLGTGFGAIADLKIGPDGAVYVVSISNGSIYRLTSKTPTSTPSATATPTRTPTITPAVCALDVDGDGEASVATDVVYIARHRLGLVAVPPSFRVLDPTIPSDAIIAANIDAIGDALDVDMNSIVDVATDVVYIARHHLGLVPVPPSFRVLDPSIPSDAVIAAAIAALCP